jgi:hypothetical protein
MARPVGSFAVTQLVPGQGIGETDPFELIVKGESLLEALSDTYSRVASADGANMSKLAVAAAQPSMVLRGFSSVPMVPS